MKYNNNFPPLFVSFIENPTAVVNTGLSQNKDLAKLIETEIVYRRRSWAVRTVDCVPGRYLGMGRPASLLYYPLIIIPVNLKHQHWQHCQPQTPSLATLPQTPTLTINLKHCQHKTLTLSTLNNNTVNTFNISYPQTLTLLSTK